MKATSRILKLALAVVLSTLFVGCDPTRRIRQSVTLEFSSDLEEDLFSCESVSIRENVRMTEIDKRREAINPGRFESLYPWHGPIRINDMQQASFSVETVMIAATGDKTPPSSQHPFSGKSFLVQLEGCSNGQPSFEIAFVKGEVAVQGKYSVKVAEISKAVYVKGTQR